MAQHTVAHREVLKATYLTYVNDFISIEAFAEWLNVTPGDAAALIYLGKTMHNEDAEAERRARRPRSVEPVPMPPPPLAPHPAEEAPQWSRGAVIAGRIAAVVLGLGALVLVLHGVFGG